MGKERLVKFLSDFSDETLDFRALDIGLMEYML